MDRVLRSTPATLSIAFEVDGVGTDPSPDSATVTIMRADGTPVVTAAAATGGAGGSFSYALSAAQMSVLDTLTATWVSALGTATTTVEVVGGFLFSISQARRRRPLSDPVAYPLDDLLEARVFAEQELEDACGAAFVPRYALETIVARGQHAVRLAHRRVRVIRSVSIDGAVMNAGYLAALRIEHGQLLSTGRWSRWPWDSAQIVIGYEHGYDTPPQGAGLAALDLARDRLLSDAGSSTIDPRATRIITDDGEIRLGTGGRFGIPTTDRFVRAHREPLVA